MSDSKQNVAIDVDVYEETTSDLTSTWKQAERRWGHSLHKLAPYVGGFPPALANYFINWFTEQGDTVLDPFSGGGTAPLEAGLRDRQAIGNDAFSYASVLSSAKCNPLQTSTFENYLDQKIADAEAIRNENMELLNNEDLKVFYSDYTLDQILRLREVLVDDSSKQAKYLKAIVCGILHGPSDMFLSLQTKDTYAGSVDYVRDYAEDNNLERPEVDIRPKAMRKHEIAQENTVPVDLGDRTNIYQGDARDLADVDDGEADFILTSPPYMRVLDYTWNNWIRLWWLGDDRRGERDKLDLTSDVEKYRQFMRECLTEMYRVLDDPGIAVLVVGDVKKNLAGGPRTLNTAGHIAAEASEHTDFTVNGVINDSYDIDSRGYVVFNQLKYDWEKGQKEDKAKVPIDRCLLLTKGDPAIPQTPEIDWAEDKFA